MKGDHETQVTASKTKVWDFPVRFTHWLIAGLVLFSWWTAEINNLEWHTWSGYALLALLIFRIYWGLVGSSTARFTRFLKGPGTVLRYTRQLFSRSSPRSLGHNPLGGWSAMLLWTLLLVQVLLGLFSEDVDGLASGPLSYIVSYDIGRWAADMHEVMFNVLLLFIVIHIVAVFFYLFYKKNNLITPMITGRSRMEATTTPNIAPLWRALIGLFSASALVWWFLVGR